MALPTFRDARFAQGQLLHVVDRLNYATLDASGGNRHDGYCSFVPSAEGLDIQCPRGRAHSSA